MQIINQQPIQPQFGRIITGDSIKTKLSRSDCSKNAINQFVKCRKTLRKSGINKLDNIDILLEYVEGFGYKAYAYAKKGLLRNSEKRASFTNIVDTQDCLIRLKEWGEYWNRKR